MYCIRKVADWKRCLPVELDHLPIDEIVAKAEELEVQAEIADMAREGIGRGVDAVDDTDPPEVSQDDLMRERLLNHSKVLESN